MGKYMDCIVCGTVTDGGLAFWHAVCPACHYESADLQPSINDCRAHQRVNEADREIALKALRQENFRAIAARAGALAAPGAATLLDVGCAHGWFLEAAGQRFTVLGIEPDAAVGDAAAARGLPVRAGYFPDALGGGEQFDVIVFNDVIEHIPSIDGALDACHQRLAAGGVLMLNLPSSRGFFYRLSSVFARVGWRGPFERMWQKELPSPHVHYFDAKNLTTLVERHGFTRVDSFELPSLRANGLMARLRFVGDVNKLALYAQFAAIMCAIPVLRLFPSDIVVCAYRKVPA
jgi:2-polyprenyl-3-methyl-5-hydroxy-6-metoxy-1,4-benzoquinol methylase